MTSSLIPERPLLIAPSLAATLGLEEACLLSFLADAAAVREGATRNGQLWFELRAEFLVNALPFWNALDIQRISQSLRDKGVLVLDSAPMTESGKIIFAFDQHNQQQEIIAQEIVARISEPGAQLISPLWQPDAELLKKISEYNIPVNFVREQIPEFVTYWRERGEKSHSWGAKFLKDLLHKWRDHETKQGKQKRLTEEQRETEFLARDLETPMHPGWRPNQDALEVLVKHANINRAFVEDALPEFILYWQERGEVGRTWNSKFIQHVKRQWLRFTSALEHDTEPKRIPENWQPSKDVFDVLKLANIDKQFALQQVAEFLLFWRESNQLYASWNTKFLQHVKYMWARKHSLGNALPHLSNASHSTSNHLATQANAVRSTRERSLVEDLSDRSWAN